MATILYKRQKQIINLLNHYIKRYNHAPTLVEIAKHLSVKSLATVHEHLQVLGFIAAGAPIEPYTDPNATFAIPSSMIAPSRKSYVLQVRGESMVEDGILDGDFVVVEETNMAINGDIVVAMIENGVVTLKRYFKEKNRIRLEPANSTMQPIFAKDVTIQGKCVGVIRRY